MVADYGNPPHESSHDPLAWIDEKLEILARRNLRRAQTLRKGPQGVVIRANGHSLINFGSNDYLSLAADERLATAANQAIAQEGVGAGASPLIIGASHAHRLLQDRLATFLDAEAALVFTSGYVANLATIAALTGRGDVIFSDAKNHASIIDGCRLSAAETVVYRHGDVDHLAELLSEHAAATRKLIVTDTVFSMDGDVAPLAEIAQLAVRYGAMLMVDEAHATGVFGQTGRGIVEQLGIAGGAHVHIGTLSKALGCAGGFVAGSQRLVDWLFNRARGYVFSTAPPPSICAAACAALDIVRAEPQRRTTLLQNAGTLRTMLVDAGFDTGASTTHIVPVIVGDAVRTMKFAMALRERGLFVPGIRPPTVPPGESMLRVSLTYGHDAAQLRQLVDVLVTARETLA